MPQSPRLTFDLKGGMNTVDPPDELKPGQYPYLQNVRRLLGGRIIARPPLGSNLISGLLPGLGPYSFIRMSDTTADGPPSGYAFISGAAAEIFVNDTLVKTGLSGNPLSFLTFRPPQSPQPWCYIGDANSMWKVRSDGTIWKQGIAEPQVAPSVAVGSGAGANWVSYRYTYFSSVTGAESNPSPESAPQIQPQTSLQGSLTAASGGVINPNITVNSSQYEGNGSQIRTVGSVGPGVTTDYVVAHNFGLSVPSNVNVDGVLGTMNWIGQFAGTGFITGVALFYQGQIIGQIKAPGTQNSQSATTATQGGDSDSWGTVLTPAIVNDSTFGVGWQITTAESGGSDRSFFNNFAITVYYTNVSNTLTCTASSDPQVDTNNIYRMDPGLDNFTFVGSTTNGGGFTDTQSDLAIAANPILSFANYEPFPSIDLPRKGTVNVVSGSPFNVVEWVSGDIFNVRWLPGTIIKINGIAYTLYNRPQSTALLAVNTVTSDTGFVTFGSPPTGTGLSYSITEPSLAAQPSPVLWGPTPDNAGSFAFGLDPLNPGQLVWTLGNNFDSAPDTNRMDVTSPSEPLMNGTITSELSTVFSTDRMWLIYPNFSDAIATVTGTQGQQWTLVQSGVKRGLYMRWAIAALGSLIAFRAKDGIFVSIGGGPEQDISANIYNLFPHGGQAPQPVTIAGYTVYPPDDGHPESQILTIVPGYIFYDYFFDEGSTHHTLVYDMEAKGWSVDLYQETAISHSWAIGEVNQALVGCTDGSIRAFDSVFGTESQTAVVVTPSVNGGSTRTIKRIGGIFLRAMASSVVTLAFWANRFQQAITGFSPSSAGPASGENDYLIDFTNATGADVQDLGTVLTFPVASGVWLKEWQPDWTEIPEPIAAWRTGMLSYGLDGWLHIPWLRFAYQSTTAVTLTLTTDQGATATIVIPSSGGVPAKFFTWVPAINAGDSMKFRMLEWVADAGGTPFTIFSGDIEVAIKPWGTQQGYQTLRPFKAVSGIPQATT